MPMAQVSRKKKRHEPGHAERLVNTFTKAAQKIGLDGALIGTATVLTFSAAALWGPHTLFGWLYVSAIVGWNGTKYVTFYIERKKIEQSIDQIKVDNFEALEKYLKTEMELRNESTSSEGSTGV
jgi:hypothetical protein